MSVFDCMARDQIAFLSGSQPISVLENGQKSNFDHEEYSRVPDKTATPLYSTHVRSLFRIIFQVYVMDLPTVSFKSLSECQRPSLLSVGSMF